MKLTTDLILRKQMVELSPILTYDIVRRHEVEWGLDACRVPGCKRPIIYSRTKVVIVLVRLGILTAPSAGSSQNQPN